MTEQPVLHYDSIPDDPEDRYIYYLDAASDERGFIPVDIHGATDEDDLFMTIPLTWQPSQI
jgi:hypothetical protein